MPSVTLTEDEPSQDQLAQPSTQASGVQQANTEECTSVTPSAEPTLEVNASQESQENFISRTHGHAYSGILVGNDTRNVFGNIRLQIDRIYNAINDEISKKEYRIKKILAFIGICLFFVSAAVGLYFQMYW